MCVIPEQLEAQCLHLDDIKNSPPPHHSEAASPGMTVISLHKKQKSMTHHVPFLKKSPEQKESIIICWFIKANEAEAALNGWELIGTFGIFSRDFSIPMKCTDENVDLNRVRKYFTTASTFVHCEEA
ncbi:hypothetical protein LSH36_983g00111 [Paralvinella palmiformis]|uniref:Uncharacterized protein n=1 Tax=Paralvinella palmiformis TaxID=53620 RepID=A0AAD9MS76_9ANNE|nr:hypothetical protein LSH36_983g00111 [Paralvinella palmiformis]